MKILTFWYVVCTIFCIYSLQTLVEEGYEVNILAKDEKETELIVLACKELSYFDFKKTKYELNQMRADLIRFFKDSRKFFIWRKRFKAQFESLILKPIEARNYLIFNGRFCLPETDVFINRLISSPVYFAFKESPVDFVQIPSREEQFDQLVVLNREAPYSDCSITESRFGCLNECFKEKFRLSRYLYDGNETGIIDLNWSMNESIEESEKSCFGECQRENCKIVQLTPSIPDQSPKTTTLKARPKLSKSEFWSQFIGLVCSFANISLTQFASLVIKFVNLRIKKKKVRIALLCLKWTIFFVSLACFCYLCYQMILEYKAEKLEPDRKEITRNHIKQKIVNLVICVDIIEYLSSHNYSLDFKRLKKTMLEIEKATDGSLEYALGGIYLNYQGRLFKANYIIESKVRFMKKTGYIYRCFVLLIQPDYQIMPSDPKLTIKFKLWKSRIPTAHKLYLLTKRHENLNEETFEIPFKQTFKKRTVRLKSSKKCVDYERYGNCTSKFHCFAGCINRKTFEKFGSILIDKIVDKEQFSPKDWKTSYPIEIEILRRNRRTYEIYENISGECQKEIFSKQQPCFETKFETTVEITPPEDSATMELDLFLEVELSIEELSLFKLILNIMNIQSVFFGMTVLKLLRMLYSSIKPKLGAKNDNISWLIYLLCSLGFSWHTYGILKLSIKEELTYNAYYELAERVHMPEMAFCQQIGEKLVNKNHKLTGNYLDQLTKEITPDFFFENIHYLNESNEWTPLNPNQGESFFFMNLKCFRITADQCYHRNQFHFSENRQFPKVLKVNFKRRNKKRDKESKTVYFMTKNEESKEFSNIVRLFYGSHLSNHKYSVDQNKLMIKVEDRFSFIKNYLSIVHEDEFSYLGEKLLEFKNNKYSFRTLKIPLEKNDFDYELEDDLFDQHFIQIQNVTTHSLLDNSDIKKSLVFNQLRNTYFDSDLVFSLGLFEKTLLAVNEENFAKLVLNLLNALFLWYDLGILDLHPGFIYLHDYLLIYLYLHLPVYLFNKINQFLLFSEKWLKKFERPLYERLRARKQKARKPRRF